MGRILRSFRLGMKSLLLHKLRSGLTVLGIVFGVAAVIAMLAIGEGASRDAQQRYQALGAVNIILKSKKPSEESQAAGGRGITVLSFGLKYEDYNRIIETVPTIKKALPIREIANREVRRLNYKGEARIVATTHEYADFNRLKMARGRFLTSKDNEKYENFCVLGAEICHTLFPYEDPLEDEKGNSRSVKLGSDYYTIVGVTEERAGSAAVGGSISAQEYNRDVYIPLNTCKLRFGERTIDRRSGSFTAEETQLTQITLQVGSIDEVERTAPIVKAIVEPHHPKKDVDFVVPLELIRDAERSAAIFSLVLGSIAAISLIVGGIGIMNIMLATVTERTREIGIRRALGAKRRDITEQFLIEAVVLSGVGGILGVGLGIGVPHIVTYFATTIKAAVTPKSVILSFAISVAVGILFGLYPANRAAKMDPIDALRHE
jgi:putative ABC transport system permease protein